MLNLKTITLFLLVSSCAEKVEVNADIDSKDDATTATTTTTTTELKPLTTIIEESPCSDDVLCVGDHFEKVMKLFGKPASVSERGEGAFNFNYRELDSELLLCDGFGYAGYFKKTHEYNYGCYIRFSNFQIIDFEFVDSRWIDFNIK